MGEGDRERSWWSATELGVGETVGLALEQEEVKICSYPTCFPGWFDLMGSTLPWTLSKIDD